MRVPPELSLILAVLFYGNIAFHNYVFLDIPMPPIVFLNSMPASFLLQLANQMLLRQGLSTHFEFGLKFCHVIVVFVNFLGGREWLGFAFAFWSFLWLFVCLFVLVLWLVTQYFLPKFGRGLGKVS